MRRSFHQVDVFGDGPCSGNPLAVVHDAAGLSTEEMLRFTEWTNLSEATFLLPPADPGADYRVRIFCPGRELPFAGHPTLGSCQAWLAAGHRPKHAGMIVQECGAGLVPVRQDGELLAFSAPPTTRSGPIDTTVLHERVDQLGLHADDVVDAAWIDNGPGWMGILLHSAAAVLAVELPGGRIPGFDVGVIGPHPPGSECAIEVRGLFTDASGQVREDPVTGSLNASVAQWLLAGGRLTAPYVAAQGTALGRRGRVYIREVQDRSSEPPTIWVGGTATVVVSGTIDW